MSKRFLFFENFKSIADKLPDDMRLKFYDALLAYVFDGVEPDDMVIAALIIAIKPSLDKEETRGGVREGAGRPKQNPVLNNQKNQNNSKEIKNNQNAILNNQKNQSFLETGNRKEETKEKDTLKCVQKEKVKNFVKPTHDEISQYCLESGNNIDVGRFYHSVLVKYNIIKITGRQIHEN